MKFSYFFPLFLLLGACNSSLSSNSYSPESLLASQNYDEIMSIVRSAVPRFRGFGFDDYIRDYDVYLGFSNYEIAQSLAQFDYFDRDLLESTLIARTTLAAQATDEMPICPLFVVNSIQRLRLAQNCLFCIISAESQQQTTKGTRAEFSDYSFNNDFLIEKNQTDSVLADGERIPIGIFQRTGTYKYDTISSADLPDGHSRTIIKIKRIPINKASK